MRSNSHSQVNYKYLHPIMSEALRQSLGNYYDNSISYWTIGGANYAVATLIDSVRI